MKADLFSATDASAVNYIRPILGYPEYFADSDGNIYSTKRGLRRLKLQPHRTGYLVTYLINAEGKKVARLVHALVCAAFHGERPTGMLACHNPDPTKTNNRADNLRWQTRLENAADSRRDGTVQNAKRKLVESDVRSIRKFAGTMTNKDLAKIFGVGLDCIRLIIKRKRWKHVE